MTQAEPPEILCTILGYHEVGCHASAGREPYVVSPEAFERQLASLMEAGGRCVSLEELARSLTDGAALPKRAFALTFDDGYLGVFTHALDIMEQYDATSTVFVPSQLVGQRAGPDDPAPFDTMDLDQLHGLVARGHAIGAHTRTHADLQRLDDDDLLAEIEGSRRDLHEMTGTPITSFCYPFGRYTEAAVSAVKGAGYTLACTTRHGSVARGHDPLLLKRVMVREDTAAEDVVHWEMR